MLAAIQKGDAKKVVELMRQTPGFDVNLKLGGYGQSLLHCACLGGWRSAVIPLLFAHSEIDVNIKDINGWTPFYCAFYNGFTSCVREMLKDFRVKVNEPNNYGRTPLWFAAARGRLDAIKEWIASGREIDLGKPGDVDKTDVIGAAKKCGKTEVVRLLEKFKENLVETRHAMRVELGFLDDLAAEVFAIVVFLSDGLLQVSDATPSTAARFFTIANQLPLELQMLICHKAVGLNKEIIPGKDSEIAFRELTNSFENC